MDTISLKIAATGLLFLVIGLGAAWSQVITRNNPSDGFKIFFGLCLLGGAAALLIGILSYIWF